MCIKNTQKKQKNMPNKLHHPGWLEGLSVLENRHYAFTIIHLERLSIQNTGYVWRGGKREQTVSNEEKRKRERDIKRSSDSRV